MGGRTSQFRLPRPLGLVLLSALLLAIIYLLLVPSTFYAQGTSITSTPGAGNLGTTVTQVGNSYNITGGTRQSNGPNLFHSFGDFSVGVGDIGNFQNTLVNGSFPVTSNILGRVTGGNISNIYGTLQTTGFGAANLFLMNPSGIVLGPSASLNVGGSVSFTTAQYIRLFDGVSGNANFYANPANDGLANSILAIDPSAFEFLSASPAAYGFLTAPEPNAAITVQGSALAVPSGQSISLVGGKVTIQSVTPDGGTAQPAQLLAPNGRILLATTASPGEFDVNTLQSLSNVDGASFTSFGTVSLAPGSSIDVHGTSTVFIKGGQLVLSVNDATLNTSENAAPSDTVSLSPGTSIVTSNSGADPGAEVQMTVGAVKMDGAMIQTINSGDLDGGNISINSMTVGLANGASITSTTVGDGNGGNITANVGTLSLINSSGINTINSTVGLGRGGDVIVQGLSGAAGSAADSVTLDNLSQVTSQTMSGPGRGGDVNITTNTLQVNNGSLIDSVTSFGTGSGGDITLNVENLTVSGGSLVRTTDFSSGILDQDGALDPSSVGAAGNLTVQGINGGAADSVVLSGTSQLGTQAQDGAGGILSIKTSSLSLDGGSSIFTTTNGLGRGGDINVMFQEATLEGGATITTGTFAFDQAAGAGGKIMLQGLDGNGSKADSLSLNGLASLVSDSFGLGSPGAIEVHANTVSLADQAVIAGGNPLTTGTGGRVTIEADLLSVAGASQISSQSFAQDAGQVTIAANHLTLDNGSIVTTTASPVFGRGGDVVVNVESISLANSSKVNSSTSATGRAGDIVISAAQSITVDSGSSIVANTTGQGNAGNVLLNADTVTVANDSQISTAASLPEGFFGQPSDLTGNAGNIEITTTSNSLVVSHGGTITSATQIGGNAGTILITTPNLMLDHATITTNTSSSGNAGSITAKVGTVTLSNGAAISSSSTGEATGAAGSVTIQGLASPANAVTITNSSLLTSSDNTGQGGSIVVDATNISLNNATISASVNNFDNSLGSSDSATVGLGNIDLTASTMTMTGSTVTTESSGLRNAGDIRINPNVAGDSFEMQNSTLNTSAGLSDGGNIQINVNNMFQMTNSVVTSSVGNPQKTDTQGGNIAIDPDNVILQNSQIIAQAFAGTGGNISIVSNVFLADPSSVVDASSTLGISGTVDIRSPVSNISGIIGRLPESVLATQALLRAACAARLAESKVSSFVERGRDHIPVGPEGLLATPYVPPLSEPSALTSPPPLSLGSTSGIQARRLMGQDFTPRVHVLSGDAACQS